MANVPIGGKLRCNLTVPNVDAKYGPFPNIDAAFAELNDADWLCAGLTIGITQQDGSIKEYWIKKKAGENFAATDFVEKSGGGSVKKVNDVDPDDNGNVVINVGVKKVNGQTPNENGEVTIPTGGGMTDDERMKLNGSLKYIETESDENGCYIKSSKNNGEGERDTLPTASENECGVMTPAMLAQLNSIPKTIAVPISSFDESRLEGDLKDYNDVYVIED